MLDNSIFVNIKQSKYLLIIYNFMTILLKFNCTFKDKQNFKYAFRFIKL